MNWNSFILDCILAMLGGLLGASISALGGFVLFGLFYIIGFLYLLFTNQDSWLSLISSSVILKPSVCFIGGVIAAAYARKKKLIECGKDIGRPLILFNRPDILIIGSIAGLAGFLVNYGFDYFLSGKTDTIALSVFFIPLVAKYLWSLTKTNDCEATSHAVPSPYRFFEKLSSPIGKIILTISVGLITALITYQLALNQLTAPYAGGFVFIISALSLFFIFLKIPIPVTHHYSGPAGATIIYWLALNKGGFNNFSIIALILWGIAAAAFGLIFSEIMGKLFFQDGDIHIDPPAMGIIISTGFFLGILPLTGIYNWNSIFQSVISLIIIIISLYTSLIFQNKHQ